MLLRAWCVRGRGAGSSPIPRAHSSLLGPPTDIVDLFRSRPPVRSSFLITVLVVRRLTTDGGRI